MPALEKYARSVYQPPYPEIPSNWRLLWEEKGLWKSLWRLIKRHLILILTGQRLLMRAQIPKDAKRILLIYKGRPQLGDSIQELSGRILLQGSGYTMDLLTEEFIASLYAGDPLLRNIYTASEKPADDYDFVILMTMSWKNLRYKLAHQPCTRFSVVYGNSHGVEVDQLGLSYAAFSAMTGVERPVTCQAYFNLKYAHKTVAREPRTLAIAVGGVESDRTYQHWPAVVGQLLQTQSAHPDFKILLLGSGNGSRTAQDISRYSGQDARVQDLVGKTTLEETFWHLQRASLLLCADGGLMHLAVCARTPVIALFTSFIHPLFRLKRDAQAITIHAPHEVSDIPAEHVVARVASALEQAPSVLQMEFLGQEPVYN